MIVPTPVLGEILVRASDAGPAYLDALKSSARFRLQPFDVRAAVEVAQMTREAIESGDKKRGSSSPWHKIKFDQQIVAIARTEGATVIYSDDDDIRRLARRLGIDVIGIADLALPPGDPQGKLFGPDAGPDQQP